MTTCTFEWVGETWEATGRDVTSVVRRTFGRKATVSWHFNPRDPNCGYRHCGVVVDSDGGPLARLVRFVGQTGER